MQVLTLWRKRQYMYWAAGVGGAVVLGFLVWLVPSLRTGAEQAYLSGRHILLGEEKMETPVVKASPSPSNSSDAIKRIESLESRVVALSGQVTEAQAALKESQQQLKAAVTEVATTKALLQKNQAALVAALKKQDQPAVTEVTLGTSSEETSETAPGLINLNTATAAQLDSLPGIGPSYAQRIIEYREQKGAFTKVDDLLNISGIGSATLAKIKDKVTV